MGSKRPPYFAHLSRDERLKPLLAGHQAMELTVRKDLWLYLTVAVMAQQLSTRVASVIRQRFMDLYRGEPTPEQVLATPVASLRAIGLSFSKAAYIHNIARFYLESGISFGILQAMTDVEVVAYLTQIKGVGQWTAPPAGQQKGIPGEAPEDFFQMEPLPELCQSASMAS